MSLHPRIRWLALALLPLLAALPSPPAASASTGAYQVEVLIFRAVNPPMGEDLSQPAEGRGFVGQAAGQAAAPSAGAASDDAPPAVLRTLNTSQMQLGGMASRLRASGEYTVLAHAAWVQTATEWPRHDGLTLEQLGINSPALSGTMYLEHGQYLHLGFDLRLGNAPAWSLRELRKIRFNEKNYFDHPGYGVIAIVSPARATG